LGAHEGGGQKGRKVTQESLTKTERTERKLKPGGEEYGYLSPKEK